MRRLFIIYFLLRGAVLGFKGCTVIGSGAHSLSSVWLWLDYQRDQALIAGDPEKSRAFASLSRQFFDRLVEVSHEGFQASVFLGITSLLHFCIAAGLLMHGWFQPGTETKKPNKAPEPTPGLVTPRALK